MVQGVEQSKYLHRHSNQVSVVVMALGKEVSKDLVLVEVMVLGEAVSRDLIKALHLEETLGQDQTEITGKETR